MNMVTVLLVVLGVVAYAGLGYLAIKENMKIEYDLYSELMDADIELLGELTYCLTDEYRSKTCIEIKNPVLEVFAIALVCLVWPISALLTTINYYRVYRKLMKRVNKI